MSTNPLKHSLYLEMFPSCILQHVWPESVQLNQILRKQILDKEKKDAGITVSNLGGWHSANDFQQWPGEAVSKIVERAIMMARELTTRVCHVDGSDFASGWKLWSWANVNRKGDRNVWHRHIAGQSHWSGVYYVDVGSIATDANAGGRITFLDRYQPRLAGRELDLDILAVRPEPGLMLVFPSSLTHKVEPYNGEEVRISIAFNIHHPGLMIPHRGLKDLQADRKVLARNKSRHKLRSNRPR